MLDDTDGGPAENILFEEGVKFAHNRLESQQVEDESNNESLISTLLHPIDQAIILSLCLDVSNNNPAVSNFII